MPRGRKAAVPPAPPEEPKKTYIMETTNGQLRRITVPASWKVTFGPLVPGRPSTTSYTEKSSRLALRFYESDDRQRAVFTDVVSFRDESIPLQERVTRTKSKGVARDTPHGRKEAVVEARIIEWIDPNSPPPEDDEDDEEFLRITQQ